MGIAFADLFQLDHVTITMGQDDVAAIEERLADLGRIVPIAGRDTTRAESGSWNALYLGSAAGYIEIFEGARGFRESFSVSLRSRKKDSLDDLRNEFVQRSIPHSLYKERLTDGGESMDWFRCIESVLDGQRPRHAPYGSARGIARGVP